MYCDLNSQRDLRNVDFQFVQHFFCCESVSDNLLVLYMFGVKIENLSNVVLITIYFSLSLCSEEHVEKEETDQYVCKIHV